MFDELFEPERIVDLYKLARYTYRVGSPIIDDEVYESIEEIIIETGLTDLHKQSYDDDEIPYDLLKEFNLSHLSFSNTRDLGDEMYSFLNAEKSLSIKSVTDYSGAFQYFCGTPNEDKVLSVKINGINTKSVYKFNGDNSVLDLSLSRGRTGNGFDLTKNMSRVIPTVINTDASGVIFYGESYASMDSLAILSKNGQALKTERSAAISMLRTDYADEDYKHLHVRMFNAEGLSDTLLGTFEKLEELGFEVSPYLFIKASDVPKTIMEFTTWLKVLMDKLHEECVKYSIPADGLVVDVNNLNSDYEVKDKYSARNVALKFEHWGFKYFSSTVRKIHIEQQRVKCSVRAEIEPINVDGCTATFVNLHSPNIIAMEDIRVGSTIYFERDSGAISNLIYGHRLKQLLYGGVNID